VLNSHMRRIPFRRALGAGCIFAAFLQLWACSALAQDSNEVTAFPVFFRSFDFGRWATPFVDPDRPPVLELITLSGGSTLRASAFYHNTDSSEAKKVEGRDIVEWNGYPPRFWPYARLEVSNEWEGNWTVIGSSPPGTESTETAVLMYPDQAAYVQRSAPESRICEVDLTPFREFIGKFKFGRIVLRSGGTSQTIVLTDLLPPEPSPTPSPPPNDRPTALQ
jgi:hypothetical protein